MRGGAVRVNDGLLTGGVRFYNCKLYQRHHVVVGGGAQSAACTQPRLAALGEISPDHHDVQLASVVPVKNTFYA